MDTRRALAVVAWAIILAGVVAQAMRIEVDPELLIAWLGFYEAVISALAWPAALVLAILVFRKQLVGLLPTLSIFKALGVEAYFNLGLQGMEPLQSSITGSDSPTEEMPLPAEQKPDQSAPPRPEEDTGGALKSESEQMGSTPPAGEPQVAKRVSGADIDLMTLPVVDISPKPRNRIADQIQEAQLATLADTDAVVAITASWSAVESEIFQLAKEYGFKGKMTNAAAAIIYMVAQKKVDPRALARYAELKSLKDRAVKTKDFSPASEDVKKFVSLAFDLIRSLRSPPAKQPSTDPLGGP